MTQNKQTWEESKQLTINSKWSNKRYKDALLNTGIPLPENNWSGSDIPVKWTSDSSYKKPSKGILLTYSFIHKKSKFNYEDDRGKIRPAATFSKQQQRDISKLFNLISSYTNIKFKKVKDANTTGTIRIGFNEITDEQGKWLPGIYATADPPNPEPRGGDIWFNKNFTHDNFSLGLIQGQKVTPSGVMLHEILHTLGLEHPYDNPKRPTPLFAQNREHTLMADEYLDNQGFIFKGISHGVSSTPMAWDIAGLQHLYGPNKETNRGKTSYKFSNKKPFYKTIWDASGIDTFDFRNFRRPLKIDLRAGQISTLSFDVEDQNWANKKVGNLGIAFGCVIERCIGGHGDDVITGNVADNILSGNHGNDILFGEEGNDTLIGGRGLDTFKVEAGKGHAVIKDFTDGEDKIVAPANVNLRAHTKGNDVQLFQSNDLIAIVENAAGLIQHDGSTFS